MSAPQPDPRSFQAAVERAVVHEAELVVERSASGPTPMQRFTHRLFNLLAVTDPTEVDDEIKDTAAVRQEREDFVHRLVVSLATEYGNQPFERRFSATMDVVHAIVDRWEADITNARG